MESRESRAIIHVDLDAFYPSVEMRDNPGLKGRPVVVGGTGRRGVVSSASYEARRFGVHSAQPMATARRLCPSGIFLPVRMSRYKEMSRQVFEVFQAFSPQVEPLSIDEAFLDVTGSRRLFGPPEEIAEEIRTQVRMKTGLTVSAGVAPSKFVAKIASDINKPDGLTVVPPEGVDAFLVPLSIDRMWGVGRKTRERLHRLGVRTIGDLKGVSRSVLVKRFGAHGLRMHRLAWGEDVREVTPSHDAKTISHEETFSRDLLDGERARRELLALSNKVARRMRRRGIVGKRITLKVKYGDFRQITRSETLAESTNMGMVIYTAACRMLDRTEIGRRPVRLLGVCVSRLNRPGSGEQLCLFPTADRGAKRADLEEALDSLAARFGEDSVRPAALLDT